MTIVTSAASLYHVGSLMKYRLQNTQPSLSSSLKASARFLYVLSSAYRPFIKGPEMGRCWTKHNLIYLRCCILIFNLHPETWNCEKDCARAQTELDQTPPNDCFQFLRNWKQSFWGVFVDTLAYVPLPLLYDTLLACIFLPMLQLASDPT